MIGSTLDQPGVASVPDEALMKAISRRRYDALAELYDRHGKRLRATIDESFMKKPRLMMSLQEIFIQIWKEAGRYSPKAGKPLGWMVYHRAPPCHRPVTQASGLFSCTRALPKARDPAGAQFAAGGRRCFRVE